MALITEIRNRFGLVVVLLAMALAAFVLMDMTSASNLAGSSNFMAGEVDGEMIDWKDFQQAENILYRNSGGDMFARRNYLWDYFVEEKLMSGEADALGITVTDEQVEELKTGTNLSPVVQTFFTNPQTRQFDQNYFQQFKQQYDNDQLDAQSMAQWEYLDNQVRADRVKSYFTGMVEKGLYTPNYLAEFIAKNQQSRADIAYVKVPYDALPAVEVSDSDLSSYLSQHKAEYMSDVERRTIDFISFDITPTSEDSAKIFDDLLNLKSNLISHGSDSIKFLQADGVYPTQYLRSTELTPAQLENLYNREVGTIYGPYLEGGAYRLAKLVDRKAIADSVEARHILRRVQTQDEYIAAKSLLDSLQLELENGNVDFATLAEQYGTDATKDRGGDLGMVAPGAMVKPFNDLIFYGAEQGKVYQVGTQFGLHLVEVTKKKYVSEDRNGVRLAFIDRPIVPTETTQDVVYDRAQEVITTYPGISGLRKYAEENNIEIITTSPLAPNDYSIGGLGANQTSRDIVRWAHSADASELSGDVYIYENKELYYNERLVLAGLNSVIPAGLPSVASMRDDLQVAVMNKKKAEAASAAMSGKSLTALAGQYGVTVDTAYSVTYNAAFVDKIGNEPSVVGATITTAEGSLSPAVAGNSGVFVIQPVSKTEVDGTNNLAFYRKSGAAGMKRSVQTSLLKSMKEAAEINDQRAQYY